MFFAQVREFEDIFRETEAPPPEPGMPEEKAGKLVELQKQVVNANWRVVRDTAGGKKMEEAVKDVAVVRESEAITLEQTKAEMEKAEDAEVKQALTEAWKGMREALDALELQFNAGLSNGAAPGPMASALKILGTELSQRLTELEVEAALPWVEAYQPHLTLPGGPVPGFKAPADGLGVGPAWAAKAFPKYLNDRAGSIYAGTNEIQRGILWQYLARRNG
jgi:alkylation response protein AidB-like acyl-CoA dehydrogenase